MTTMLFHAHSGLRYLVLLAGAVALLWFLGGWILRKRYAAPAPAALAAFLGLVDLQALLGIAMWIGGRRPARLVDHLVTMLAAVFVLHLTSVTVRRRSEPAGFGAPLLGVLATLGLILLGIRLLGRSIL